MRDPQMSPVAGSGESFTESETTETFGHGMRSGLGAGAPRLAEVDPNEASDEIEWTPEHTLMLAVLEDAIHCYRRTLKRPRQNPEVLARQAEFWLRLDDWESPFSFNNICEALGFDVEATRERILEHSGVRCADA